MSTRTLVIIAVAAALSAALSFLRLFEMPQGGSVTLDVLPIFYVALWRGPWTGIGAGALAGLIQLLLRPFIVHPLQVLLDYPLAMAACGIAGFFRGYDSERVFRTGLSIIIGAAVVLVAGLQWLELRRISDAALITLARQDDLRVVLKTRPDPALGDVEGTIVTVRMRQDGRADTVGVISSHGDTARRWLSEAMGTVRARQLKWFGSTGMFLLALIGVALLARYLTVGLVGLGVLAGSTLKFGIHLVSGAIFFAAYAPVGGNVWAYSAAYNAAYLIPQTVLALVLVPPLLRRAGSAAITRKEDRS